MAGRPQHLPNKPQMHSGEQIPEKYRPDLGPGAMAGQNIGAAGPHPEKESLTAFDIKDLHLSLKGFHDDELKQIHILPVGTRLEQNATYLDLRHPELGEFKGDGDMSVDAAAWIVAKNTIDYQLWNRLKGVTSPARTGKGNAS